MTRARVAVIGVGMVSPLDGVDGATWDAIAGGYAPEGHQHVSDTLLAPERFAGEDRLFRLARTAARRALDDAGTHAPATLDLPIFAGTSKGPVTSLLEAARRCGESAGYAALPPWLARAVAFGPSGMADAVGEALGSGAARHTSVAACSSGLVALHRAVRAIQFGDADRALVVAADASVHALFEGAFARLGVLARPDAAGIRHCRPGEGSGFYIAEGAAAMVLERYGLSARGGRSALLADTWIGGQAYDLIGSDPAGDSLRRGLAALAGERLAFVQAHAPGTAHDAFELAALAELPGSPPIFSHKRWIGHTLGAAGLIGAVLSVESHRRGRTPDGNAVDPHGASLTIAQGFGGAVAILRLVPDEE